MSEAIDTPQNIAPGIRLTPALCLDLDGTVRRTKSGEPFAKAVDDMELMPGMESIIWKYRNLGYLIIGISNQAGVAFGFKTPSQCEKELAYMCSLFAQNPFHVIKQCYHAAGGKTEPYRHRSLLRKPDIGMLATAEFDCWNAGYMIDWDKSLFVGDRPEDQECAKNAGIPFYHIDTFLNMPHTFEIKS